MADHPLRPATDRCLGKPLPYQLANQPRAHLQADKSFSPIMAYGVLAIVSNCYPPPRGRFSRVTHPSATRIKFSYDLHVLGIPPALILSQDQTLHYISILFNICFFFPLDSDKIFVFIQRPIIIYYRSFIICQVLI